MPKLLLFEESARTALLHGGVCQGSCRVPEFHRYAVA